MRKIIPENLRADFAADIGELMAFYERLKVGQSDKDQSLLAENVILSSAVLWEGFVNDLLIAYINRDGTQFATHLRNALDHNLTAKQAAVVGNYAQVTFPAHFKKGEIASLLDDKGNNITFPHFGELVDRSEAWLLAAHHDRISGRSDAQRRVVNVLIATRNHIAHRSARSSKAMNDELNQGVLHPTGLRRGTNAVSNVGSYFKSTPGGHQQSRVHLLLGAIRLVGSQM